MSVPVTNLSPGDLQFYDNQVPSLPAGVYEAKSVLSLPNSVTDHFKQENTQQFVVRAPQFQLPGATIVSMFPAGSANGAFSRNFPYVVLNGASLPWEREIYAGEKTIPWLALLVFNAGEIEVDPVTNSPIITSTVEAFLKPEEGVVKPAIKDVPPEILLTEMTSIRIPVTAFTEVTPRKVELSSLVHVREVSLENQEIADPDRDGWYSVVFANRFPFAGDNSDNAGAINYVHLVSLEGLTDYLVDNPDWKGATQVQLNSLAAWSFFNVNQQGQQTFSDLASNLISQVNGNFSELLLSVPTGNAPASTAVARLKEGYGAFGNHTDPGPQTFAWYRGPFSPVVPQPLPPGIAQFMHVTKAMIYDQNNAIFDHSYAAASTIGRLTALADPVFISAVREVDRKIGLATDRLLARSKMPHLAGVTDLRALAAPGITRTTFIGKVQKGLGHEVTALFNSPEEGEKENSSPKNFLFPDEEPPRDPVAEVKWFFEKKNIREFLQREIILADSDPLTEWFTKLALLYPIPFNHLVPDQRMLPAESIRFFYVDAGWLKVLFDGALSAHVNTARSLAHTELMSETLWPVVQQRMNVVRRRLLRKKETDGEPSQLPAAGMLLRSALVSGWPGLSVTATSGGNTVQILRIDRVSPSILLVLWDKVPDTVQISEPQQGLAFGVDDDWQIALRSLDASDLGKPLSEPAFPSGGTIENFMRRNGLGHTNRVLKLNTDDTSKKQEYVVPALSAQLGLSSNLTPSQYAIEVVQSPGQISFNPPFAT